MKIKIINPDYGLSDEQLAVRIDKLRQVARPDTEITMECPVDNNIYVDSALDTAVDSCEIIRMAMAAQADGYDAVGLYCFSDPAIEACREAIDIPVIGGGQAAVLTAAQLGHSFSILTTGARRISQKKEFVRTTGVDYTRLCSVRSIEFGMAEADMSPEQLLTELSDSAAACVADGADVVILGCLSFVGLAQQIAEQIGVPVVDPAYVLVNTAELMVASQLTHSRKAYPAPPGRERQWVGGMIKI